MARFYQPISIEVTREPQDPWPEQSSGNTLFNQRGYQCKALKNN